MKMIFFLCLIVYSNFKENEIKIKLLGSYVIIVKLHVACMCYTANIIVAKKINKF